MPEGITMFFNEATRIWSSGGWLMVPLFILTFFIYYTALDLFLRLNQHFLIRGKVHNLSDEEIETGTSRFLASARSMLLAHAQDLSDVRRHFEEIENEYLPVLNRRTRFLAIIVTAGPLLGLLGTVTGMLSTFSAMWSEGRAFSLIVEGISEALITTQTGLLISIPAMVILSFISQYRRRLMLAIARLERYNTRLVLRCIKKQELA